MTASACSGRFPTVVTVHAACVSFQIMSSPWQRRNVWLDRLKMAPRSVANFRTCLGTLFGFAEFRGYVFEGGIPIAKVESI